MPPADELDLLRRRDAEAERERHANMNARLRDDLRRMKAENAGLAPPGDLLPTRQIGTPAHLAAHPPAHRTLFFDSALLSPWRPRTDLPARFQASFSRVWMPS